MVSLLLIYVFLRFPSGKKKWSDRFTWFFTIDLLLILLVMATQIYTIFSGIVVYTVERLTVQILGNAVNFDYIVGLVVVALVLEATRRAFGWVMVGLCLFFIGYSLGADLFPGPLMGAKASLPLLLSTLYVTDQGVYGVGAEVLLSMIFIFFLFGVMLVGTKVGAFFTAAANAVVGRYAGGPAKVAVVSSALVGTISGSGVANVAITGCVTIPLMKSIGYQPAFAGAVEATASSGGYFTPPIMGAAAFLIASLTRVSYLQVCLYTVVPAFLYYVAVLVQVHFRAKKDGLQGLPKNMIPSLPKVMLEGWYLLLPLVIVIVGMMLDYTVTMVAIWGILAIILLSFLRRQTRQNAQGMLLLFEESVTSTIGVLMCVVTVGIVQGVVMISGLGMRLSSIVEVLSAGNLVLGLILAAVVMMILGMGVNPLLVYYIGYLFIIPALVKAGAPELPTHIFVLIYGAVANITPPIAVAAYTAAAIAKAPAMRTGFEATKLGFAAFIVPFMIVFHPDLMLLNGVTLEAGISIVTAIAGISSIAIAFEGWLLRKASILERIVFFIGGICLIAPQLYLTGIGTGLLILVVLWQKYSIGRKQDAERRFRLAQ